MQWLLVNLIYFIRWASDSDLNKVEVFLCAAVLVAASAGWRPTFQKRLLAYLGRRRTLAIVFLGLTALGGRALILPVLPIPHPLITDEFSHLLLADTLLSGKLANPTHPMWRYFETIHVIQSPTYASMYFPAQGAVLALGKLVLGHPWWGVWLSNGLMCAVLCWMLQQWLPPDWALFGGLIAVLRLSIFSYWNDSYWGGAVPAIGGALVIGAVAKIRNRPTFADGLLFGSGAAILLYSRPFEGFALCVAGLLLCRKQLLSKATLASAVVLTIAAGGLSYYCFRVTGRLFKLPYQMNQDVYGWPMTLLWYQPHASAGALPAQMQEYYNWELSEHYKFFPDSLVQKGQFLWGFFLGPCLTVPLVFLRRDRRIRPALAMAGAVLAAVVAEQTGYPHYFSAATGALLILIVQGARHMRQTRLGYAFGHMIPAILVLTLVVRAFAGPLGLEYHTLARRLSWCCEAKESQERADLESKLSSTPGQHLVIVHYGSKHAFDREWVYNRANIDSSKIVWARDLGSGNEDLKRYFSRRLVWYVEVNN